MALAALEGESTSQTRTTQLQHEEKARNRVEKAPARTGMPSVLEKRTRRENTQRRKAEEAARKRAHRGGRRRGAPEQEAKKE